MAPTAQSLEKRQYGYNNCYGYGYYSGYNGCYYSGWNAWGRWVLLAVIIVGAFLLYFIFSCITARRRRKAGRNPYPLTGWASRPQANSTWAGHNQGQAGYGQQGYNQGGYNAPPAYGGQQYGVSEPQPVYGANRDLSNGHYAPPEGPPPSKKGDQVVR